MKYKKVKILMKNYNSNQKLIRNYIRILLENENLPENNLDNNLNDLESRYHSDIQTKNQEHQIQSKLHTMSGKGWGLLNLIIQKFKELDNPTLYQNQDVITHKTELLENILTKSGFTKAAEGSFRKVWINPNANFIVKLEKKVQSYKNWGQYEFLNTNKIEHDTYFNFGPDSQPRTELFPKIYAYDQIDKLWIIFEKVNTFKPTNTLPLEKIFAPFLLLCQKIVWVIEHEPAFKPQSDSLDYFAIHPDTLNVLASPQSDPDYFFEIVFNHTLKKMPEFYQKYGDFKKAFHELVLQKLIVECILTYGNKWIKKRPQLYQLLKNKLSENFNSDFLPTPDFLYIGQFLKHGIIDDLHINNLGYRDLKNNPTQPWKNFVILDFGGFGNPNN
jgi:hypothetical protein